MFRIRGFSVSKVLLLRPTTIITKKLVVVFFFSSTHFFGKVLVYRAKYCRGIEMNKFKTKFLNVNICCLVFSLSTFSYSDYTVDYKIDAWFERLQLSNTNSFELPYNNVHSILNS